VTKSKVSVPAVEVSEILIASLPLTETPSVEMLALAERGDLWNDAIPRAGRPLRLEIQSLLN
jgi:hypothetical protein